MSPKKATTKDSADKRNIITMDMKKEIIENQGMSSDYNQIILFALLLRSLFF